MNRSLRPWLSGAAAAAAVVLAALAGWALFGPERPPRPAAPAATASPAAAGIAQHGQAVARQADGVRYVGMEASQARPREGYRLTFATNAPELAKARDDAANAARQAAWQQRFCTPELREEMAARQVTVVTGRIVDGKGETQHAADCVAGQPPVKMGPGGPLL